ncbi:hypothetical protein CRG98_030399 [Punica granatum]|uniref:Uncharacterized protein n=1 Tax=Punica granatum TaxID=22663 RepID=A0A2I0IZV0_PUNGR|nr:hypothetical protein CRG98_030399 [Punica granatum]
MAVDLGFGNPISKAFQIGLSCQNPSNTSHTTLGCQGVKKSKNNQSVLAQHEETARLPNRVEISDRLCSFLANWVDPRPFSPNNHTITSGGNSGHDTEDLFRSLSVRSTESLAFSGFLHNPGRSRELVDTCYGPRWPHCDVSLF